MDVVESVVEPPVDEFENYTSPIRVLARFFKKSRDQWKEKCIEVKRQIKGLKNQIYQLHKSRQSWKEQALAQAKEFEALQAEFEQFKAQFIELATPNGSKMHPLRAR
jgi:chromosome segregation ATPase